MKYLWKLPSALQHLAERRWGSERRGDQRRRGMSRLFNLFGGRDRRHADRRVTDRRVSDRRVADRQAVGRREQD